MQYLPKEKHPEPNPPVVTLMYYFTSSDQSSIILPAERSSYVTHEDMKDSISENLLERPITLAVTKKSRIHTPIKISLFMYFY